MRNKIVTHHAESRWVDPRVELTQKHVNWDNLSTIPCKIYGVASAHWGDLTWGGYNLVRFLHLDDPRKTIVVARVPLRPLEGLSSEQTVVLCNRISSEVATMEYVETYTNIPIPHVIHYSAEADGDGVGSPYILMSKVHGVPLSSLWDDMEDDKRDEVMRQIIDIILDLYSQRFDKIGALFKAPDDGKEAWHIRPMSYILDPDPNDTVADQIASSTAHTSSIDYWLAHTNAYMQHIADENFGTDNKPDAYAQAWFLRSLIPAFCDPSLDVKGFPLSPSDFHSQNIMITLSESHPRITAVIDWECSSTSPTSSFAQYPLFIVDHPAWESDHSLRSRNARDQSVFNELIREKERKVDPEGCQPLSKAFANSLGPYLFQQCIQDPIVFTELYPQLFELVFGAEDFSGDYYWALMTNGLLRKETQQFIHETELWNDVSETLGEDLVRRDMSRVEFQTLVAEHRNRFPVEGRVVVV
ncbi:hypothetical protein PILCRDRAFT_95266 [Piloderma croceum F 1598]|uniref:Uncharacterized protein n=1 Tax=Piloderma croceum (strain F 1598) TaxID=765440 RepID=A0A0C3GFN6_PILCF|nr:hypothetical protein PILCRDRAFT_95266 [Piloderma croceum F 1598]